MLNKTAKSIADRLLLHDVITEDLLDVYVYGFELLLSFLFSTSVIIIAGCVMNKALETIVFLIVFILLRSFSGGYHADTYAKCSIITFMLYGTVMLFSTYVGVKLIFYVILMIAGFIILFKKAPIENPNKELTEEEKKKHRITSLILFSFFSLVGMCVNVFSSTTGSVIWIALVMDLTLMFVKTNHERRII